MGAKGDQVGAKWDQVGTAWNQVGTKWDQMKLGPMGYPKKVDFSLVLKGFSEKVCSGRPRSARLAGTPCDSLKSLLEPFSVPLLGNFISWDRVGTAWNQVGTKWGPNGTK